MLAGFTPKLAGFTPKLAGFTPKLAGFTPKLAGVFLYNYYKIRFNINIDIKWIEVYSKFGNQILI